MVVQDIFRNLKETDTLLIMNGGENAIDKTFFYLTGAESGLFEGSAVIATEGKIEIIAFNLEEQSARETGMEVTVVDTGKQMEEAVSKKLAGKTKIGVNLESLTANMFTKMKGLLPGREFIDVSKIIADARLTKSPEELKKLREAARIGTDIYMGVLDKLKEGVKETDVAADLVHGMMREGATGPSFMPIVGFGPNSSIPHYFPGDRKLKKGDFVLTDFGALYRRYCSDITRTAVFGRATDQQKEMYEIVRRAQKESMSLIKAGMNGRLVDAKALEVIDSTKYKGRFMHGLGHGIGLEVHDHGALGRTGDFELKENMVVTDEPGIYIPDYGGVRIEDDVLVKNGGFEQISGDSPKDLVEVS